MYFHCCNWWPLHSKSGSKLCSCDSLLSAWHDLSYHRTIVKVTAASQSKIISQMSLHLRAFYIDKRILEQIACFCIIFFVLQMILHLSCTYGHGIFVLIFFSSINILSGIKSWCQVSVCISFSDSSLVLWFGHSHCLFQLHLLNFLFPYR